MAALALATDTHRLCPDCYASVPPQRGAYPNRGEPHCCVCGRPTAVAQYVKIHPQYMPCKGRGMTHLAGLADD